MNMEGLDISILAPAFVAGLVVLMTHIPLGYEVLRRGIIFIDIAVAQIAGLGGRRVAAELAGEKIRRASGSVDRHQFYTCGNR